MCTHATLLCSTLPNYLLFGMMKTAFSLPDIALMMICKKSLKVDLNVEVLQDLIRQTIKLVQIKYFLTLLKFLTYFISMF